MIQNCFRNKSGLFFLQSLPLSWQLSEALFNKYFLVLSVLDGVEPMFQWQLLRERVGKQEKSDGEEVLSICRENWSTPTRKLHSWLCGSSIQRVIWLS